MSPAISGDLAASEIIRILNMKPYAEGGHYVETFRSEIGGTDRSPISAIYFLLQADEVSEWHRIDAAEIWLWHAGGPLILTIASPEGQNAHPMTLGPDLRSGQRPQGVVPANHWQTAETLGAWTLVSCAIGPGFEFDGLELAPPDWRPDV